MFEIGSALREARERKGLSYSQVEDGTKIRARYIRALEEEDFGVLPGATYSKGFLRAYADYLGLDGHLFIDEFNSRYHDPRREDEKQPIYPPSRRHAARHRRETSIVLIALAAIVAMASFVFIAAGTGSGQHVPLPTPPKTHASTTPPKTSSSTSSSTHSSTSHTKASQPKQFKVTITAALGDSWVSAHVGSASGPAAKTVHNTDLSQYLLHQNEVAIIKTQKPLIVSLGAPGNITVTVAGKSEKLPAGTQFKITRQGIAKA
jgi:cytoskeleton protein RodZ